MEHMAWQSFITKKGNFTSRRLILKKKGTKMCDDNVNTDIKM